MLPVLRLGPLTLATPGLALLLGLWLSLETASQEAVRRGLNSERVYNLGFIVALSGIAGARLGFVLLNLPLYIGLSPWTQAALAVAAVTPGTEVAWIGVLAAAAAAILLLRRWQMPALPVADSFAPAAALFSAAVGLANLLSGEAYGVETMLPWGIPLWGASRQPTQLLWIMASLAALFVLWRWGGLHSIVGRPLKLPPGIRAQRPGFYTALTAILLGAALLLIEPLRADSPVVGDGIRLWQVIGLLAAVGGMGGLAALAPAAAPRET